PPAFAAPHSKRTARGAGPARPGRRSRAPRPRRSTAAVGSRPSAKPIAGARQDLWNGASRAGSINAMQTRNLNGLTTSAIGFGAMVLVDGMYGHVDEARSLATLQHAVDAGATLIDTADAYA